MPTSFNMGDPLRIQEKQLFLLDMDGVLYRGDALLPRADEAVRLLRQNGRQVVFVTNNSGSGKAALRDKLCRLGIPCDARDIVTAVDMAIYCIRAQGWGARGVFLVGSEAAGDQLREAGLPLVSPEECSCLLVGFKRNICYEDARDAIIALARGVPFIVCNLDPYFPDADGRLSPGCGFSAGAIRGSYTREIDMLAGKPSAHVVDMLADAYRIPAARMAIVGDSLHSDMQLAKNAGIAGIYVGEEDRIPDPILRFDSLYAFASAYFTVA